MLPWRVRRAIRPAAFSAGIFCVRRGSLYSGVFQLLEIGWGNEGWSADTAYLQAACRYAMQVRGPILECGSGLTTILLGIIAPGRVTSLENIPEWAERVETAARAHHIPSKVVHSSLIDYGAFHWYSIPQGIDSGYELVICDGPAGTTLGGRYGLLGAAKHLLAPSAVILMDDADRPGEQEIIERWRSEFDITCDLHVTRNGTFASVSLKGCAQ